MKMPMRGLAAILVLTAASGPQAAETPKPQRPPPTVDGGFRLGPTGIYCIKAPCPWRGLTRIGADGKPEGRPVWYGDELPAIEAAAADRKRALAAWAASACLLVDGEFDGTKLTIRRISGAC